MRNIQKLIEMRGGLEALQKNYIKIEVPGYMPLIIENIDGARKISVAHYGEQNGDAMRDPEITFTVTPMADGHWHFEPLTFLNDYVGIYLECTSRKEARETLEFCTLWDQNILHQGFIEAFRMQLDRPCVVAA